MKGLKKISSELNFQEHLLKAHYRTELLALPQSGNHGIRNQLLQPLTADSNHIYPHPQLQNEGTVLCLSIPMKRERPNTENPVTVVAKKSNSSTTQFASRNNTGKKSASTSECSTLPSKTYVVVNDWWDLNHI